MPARLILSILEGGLWDERTSSGLATRLSGRRCARVGPWCAVYFETPVGAYPAFVLRRAGSPRAWLNRCRHVAIELDWIPGQFLNQDATAMVCAADGATYDPRTGACQSGACRGRGFISLNARECAGWVEVASPSETLFESLKR